MEATYNHLPDLCVSDTDILVSVVDQGEETYSHNMDALVDKKSLERVAGYVIKYHNKVQINPPQPLRNINHFPRHDFELIPTERYFSQKKKG